MTITIPSPSPGQCRYCMRRRPVYRITRRGGGTYRRGGRHYWSSICGECAIELHTNGWSDRFSETGLAEIAASLDHT